MRAEKLLNLRRVCLILGVTLLLSSLTYFGFTAYRTHRAAKLCEAITARIEALFPSPTPAYPEEGSSGAMPVLQAEGIDVIGMLDLPQHARTLPIRSGWDKAMLDTLPCRFSGSVGTRDLIIGSTDAGGLMDVVTSLEVGNVLYLTDVKGRRYTYTVSAIRHSSEASAEKLVDPDSDLTLFVRRASGGYVLVRFTAKASG